LFVYKAFVLYYEITILFLFLDKFV